MSKLKVPTGESQESSEAFEALKKQLAEASPEALKAALESLTVQQLESIRNEITALSESTRETALVTITRTATGGDQPDQAETTPRLYSFIEAKEFLRECGIDLEQHRDDEVRAAVRWELVDEKDADKYGATFDNLEVSEVDLQALAAQLKAHPDLEQRIVLGVDNMTSDQGWIKLIEDPIIRQYVQDRFSSFQRVNPATREPLEDQRPSGKAGILFTPDQMNLPDNLRGIPANDQLAKVVQGQRYMGPVGWMKLFRQGVDRALPVLFLDEVQDLDSLAPEDYKALVNRALLDRRIDPYLLDTITGTHFPDFRLDGKQNGAVPCSYFDSASDIRRVSLGGRPSGPDDNRGGRPVLGGFLS